MIPGYVCIIICLCIIFVCNVVVEKHRRRIDELKEELARSNSENMELAEINRNVCARLENLVTSITNIVGDY